MARKRNAFPGTFMGSLTLLMLMINALVANAQTATLLSGDKTGNYFGGSLFSLGVGHASISSPMIQHTTANPFPFPNTFRYFYGAGNTSAPISMVANQDAGTEP
ncbi:MAG: hypothetical protein EOO88_38990 [Pedobacter sp.]|nr:MAG: hypothetical protein EOO88_38990 [Pedobacter sp.]